ncbi:MFS transporter [Ruegeria atlantica]|uniref:MFS transporter n=1 Tax=Ruegeria atlantica TaxID=81569 RepID=UPI00147FD61B|nr:MFS transporter [Ruegeria atlantica]
MSRNETLQFINVAHFFDHFFLLIFPTAALAIAPDWNMDYADVLLLGSPVYIMFALGTLPVGWLGDKLDRMTLIAVFFIGCGASSLAIALSESALVMSIGLGLLGLFAAIYHPVGLAQITHIGERTGRALAVNGVFGNMGLAGAAVVTGLLAQYVGWQAAFYMPGAISVLIGVILFVRCRTKQAPCHVTYANKKNGPQVIQRSTQIRVFLIVCVSALFGGLIFNAVTISLPKFFDERLTGLGGDLTWVSASTGFVFGIAAFAQIPVGELLDRIGARSVLLPLLAGQIICLLMLIQATGISALILALLLVTFVFAEIPITTWLLGQFLKPHIRSRAVSIEYVLSLGVGAAAVPVLVMVTKSGVGFAGQFLGLAVAATFIFIVALFLPGKNTQAPERTLRLSEQ